MSVLAESIDRRNAFLDNPVDPSDITSNDPLDFQLNLESLMVDPQLGLNYAAGSLIQTVNPASMWNTPLIDSMELLEPFMQQSQPPVDEQEKFSYSTASSSAAITNHSRTTTRQGTRRSSKSSIPSMSSLDTGGAPKRTHRPSRKKQQSELGSEPEGSAKRSKYLERNRVAASKCRQKKRAWVSDLEGTKNQLESVHADLKRNYKELKDEVSQLKTAVMKHAPCNNSEINLWLETEAKMFVQRTASRPDNAPSASQSGSASRREIIAGKSQRP